MQQMLLGLGAPSSYEVDRSLRFNKPDEPYLTRDVSSTGNQKVWTFSAWIKRTVIDDNAHYIYSANDGNAAYFALYFQYSELYTYFDPGNNYGTISSRKFRDIGAWFHLVHQVDAANTTQKVWINGEELSLNSGRNPGNSNYPINQSGITQYLGTASWWTSQAAHLYMAEIHFSDGTKYTPSDFAETDTKTGQWVPKKVNITYGTNGYYLNFSDNSGTTATTLGKDSSGNSNNFTSTNISVSAGAGNDSVTDSPTNNFCTFSPLKVNASNPLVFSNGNLQHNGVSGDNHLRSSSTMQVNSGKWYVEFKFVSGYEATNGTVSFGLTTDAANNRASNNDAFWYQNTDDFLAIAYRNNGKIEIFLEGSSQHELTGLSTFVNGDVMGLAVDLDNDKLFVSKNGTWFSNGTGTQDPANGTNPLYSGGYLTSRKSDGFYFGVDGYSAQVVTADFGQQGYAYTPPSGFKKVCTANLPDPTIKLPNKHFDILTYEGTDTSASRTLSGLNFSPDWVWQKRRNGTNWNTLHDTVRGVGKTLYSNDTSVDTTNNQYGYISAFTSDGFTWSAGSTNNSDGNETGGTYVAWNWNAGGSTVTNNDGSVASQVRANTSAGFSIVTLNGTGSVLTFGHGLGVKPDVVILKARNIANNWLVYHQGYGATKTTFLDTTTATSDNAQWYNDTEPTSSVFTLGTWSGMNTSTPSTIVAYCFSEVAGYSKFGSYTGNGSTDGTFVYTGFRPAWVLLKKTSGTDNWGIFDNKRDIDNPMHHRLRANLSDAEATNLSSSADQIDFLSNGFKMRTTSNNHNGSGATIIFLAFAESPFKYSRAR